VGRQRTVRPSSVRATAFGTSHGRPASTGAADTDGEADGEAEGEADGGVAAGLDVGSRPSGADEVLVVGSGAGAGLRACDPGVLGVVCGRPRRAAAVRLSETEEDPGPSPVFVAAGGFFVADGAGETRAGDGCTGGAAS
jgi:hypothetical protein